MRHLAVAALLAAAPLAALVAADGPLSNAARSPEALKLPPHELGRRARLHIRSATAALACPDQLLVTADVVNMGTAASVSGILVEFCPAPPGVDAWIGHMTSPMTAVFGLDSLAPGASVTTSKLSLGAWFTQPVTFAGRPLSFGCCSSIPVEVKLFQPKAGAPGGLAAAPEWDQQAFTVTATPAVGCAARSFTRVRPPAAVPTPRPGGH